MDPTETRVNACDPQREPVRKDYTLLVGSWVRALWTCGCTCSSPENSDQGTFYPEIPLQDNSQPNSWIQ